MQPGLHSSDETSVDLLGKEKSQTASDEKEVQHNSLIMKKSLTFIKKPSASAVASAFDFSKHLTCANLSYSLCDVVSTKKELSFQRFVLFSIEDSDMSLDNVKNWGNSHLSPLTLKTASVCCQFPSFDSDPKEKELIPFCFPNGAEIRIIPRCLSEHAKKLGWMGGKANKYQLHEVSFWLRMIFLPVSYVLLSMSVP